MQFNFWIYVLLILSHNQFKFLALDKCALFLFCVQTWLFLLTVLIIYRQSTIALSYIYKGWLFESKLDCKLGRELGRNNFPSYSRMVLITIELLELRVPGRRSQWAQVHRSQLALVRRSQWAPVRRSQWAPVRRSQWAPGRRSQWALVLRSQWSNPTINRAHLSPNRNSVRTMLPARVTWWSKRCLWKYR